MRYHAGLKLRLGEDVTRNALKKARGELGEHAADRKLDGTPIVLVNGRDAPFTGTVATANALWHSSASRLNVDESWRNMDWATKEQLSSLELPVGEDFAVALLRRAPDGSLFHGAGLAFDGYSDELADDGQTLVKLDECDGKTTQVKQIRELPIGNWVAGLQAALQGLTQILYIRQAVALRRPSREYDASDPIGIIPHQRVRVHTPHNLEHYHLTTTEGNGRINNGHGGFSIPSIIMTRGFGDCSFEFDLSDGDCNPKPVWLRGDWIDDYYP
jgi:hypothetical protein